MYLLDNSHRSQQLLQSHNMHENLVQHNQLVHAGSGDSHNSPARDRQTDSPSLMQGPDTPHHSYTAMWQRGIEPPTCISQTQCAQHSATQTGFALAEGAHPCTLLHLVMMPWQGYRYELWCVARAAGTRYCMVHVATPTDTCCSWNTQRPEGERYSDAV